MKYSLEKVVQDDFESMLNYISNIQNELRHYTPEEKVMFYTPILRIISNAYLEILKINRDSGLEKRIDNWELLHDIIFDIKPKN